MRVSSNKFWFYRDALDDDYKHFLLNPSSLQIKNKFEKEMHDS